MAPRLGECSHQECRSALRHRLEGTKQLIEQPDQAGQPCCQSTTEEVGNGTQQITEQSPTRNRGNLQYNLIELDSQTEQSEVEWPQHECQDLTRSAGADHRQGQGLTYCSDNYPENIGHLARQRADGNQPASLLGKTGYLELPNKGEDAVGKLNRDHVLRYLRRR